MVEDIGSLKRVIDQHTNTLSKIVSTLEQRDNFSLDTKLMNLSVGELNQLLLSLSEIEYIEKDLHAKLRRAFIHVKKRNQNRQSLSADKRVIKRSELASLIAELLMIHDHKNSIRDVSRSVWLSDSGDTVCIREENMDTPYETPVQGKDDYYRTFYLEYKGDRLFTHRDFVWPNLRSDVHHEQLLIDYACYDELIAFHQKERSEWHQEFFPLWAQSSDKPKPAMPTMGDEPSSLSANKLDIHIQKGADDQLLLMTDGLCSDLSHRDIEAFLNSKPHPDANYKAQRFQLHPQKGISLSIDNQTLERLQLEIKMLLGMHSSSESSTL